MNGFGGQPHPQQRQIPRLKVCGNSLGNKEKRRAATLGDDEEEDDSSGWSMVGQDVFDFSLLRMKLQNRIMGWVITMEYAHSFVHLLSLDSKTGTN